MCGILNECYLLQNYLVISGDVPELSFHSNIILAGSRDLFQHTVLIQLSKDQKKPTEASNKNILHDLFFGSLGQGKTKKYFL